MAMKLNDSYKSEGKQTKETIRINASQIPKVELHTHLSGCLNFEDVNKFLKKKGMKEVKPLLREYSYNEESWGTCVDYFNQTKPIYSSKENYKEAKLFFTNVIKEFAAQNTVYVEFRISLKGKTNEKKSAFCKALVEVIEEQEKSNPDSMIVRLIITISRRNGIDVDKYIDTIKLVKELQDGIGKDIIVGVDLAGNPYEQRWSDFQWVFNAAKENRLNIALHVGECVEKQQEWNEMINWVVRSKKEKDQVSYRLGHCTFVDETGLALIRKNNIPVELCLRIAERWMCVKPSESVFHLLGKGHPIVICSDNPPLNKTTLTKEYERARNHLGLSQFELILMSWDAINYAFCIDDDKEKARNIFREKLQQLGLDIEMLLALR